MRLWRKLAAALFLFAGAALALALACAALSSPSPRPPAGRAECASDPAQSSIKLPLPSHSGPAVEAAIKSRRSIRSYSPESLSLQELSELLFAAQGVTGGEGFRAAPSAGALYPLTLYVQPNRVEGASCGIYRYEPSTHSLELAREGDYSAAVSEAAYSQQSATEAAAVIVFAADFSAMEAKYGARAEDFVLTEAGHASENLLLEAVSLGLGAVPLGYINQAAFNELLLLGPTERAIYVNCVGRLP
ncbi:MAG: SagB/ThcOx family dehydrogenase [Candidatus ainarchaeum sp.]|nr:SagB/ThcOx family dehydrogenase [Candidatus ainarchaeum sp.]